MGDATRPRSEEMSSPRNNWRLLGPFDRAGVSQEQPLAIGVISRTASASLSFATTRRDFEARVFFLSFQSRFARLTLSPSPSLLLSTAAPSLTIVRQKQSSRASS